MNQVPDRNKGGEVALSYQGLGGILAQSMSVA